MLRKLFFRTTETSVPYDQQAEIHFTLAEQAWNDAPEVEDFSPLDNSKSDEAWAALARVVAHARRANLASIKATRDAYPNGAEVATRTAKYASAAARVASDAIDEMFEYSRDCAEAWTAD